MFISAVGSNRGSARFYRNFDLRCRRAAAAAPRLLLHLLLVLLILSLPPLFSEAHRLGFGRWKILLLAPPSVVRLQTPFSMATVKPPLCFRHVSNSLFVCFFPFVLFCFDEKMNKHEACHHSARQDATSPLVPPVGAAALPQCEGAEVETGLSFSVRAASMVSS